MLQQKPIRRLLCVALLAAGPLLSGCAGREAEQARTAQTALVGMPLPTLLSCAGVPDRREAAGPAEFLTYQAVRSGGGRSGSNVSVGAGGGSGGFGLGVGLGFPLGGGGASGCVATFTVEDGRVSRLLYRDGSDVGPACYAIVENCLALVPLGGGGQERSQQRGQGGAPLGR